MATLKYIEPMLIKNYVEARNGPGYVLDFSDSTFQKFVKQATSIDIYQKKYEALGTSKGKRLSTFCDIESDAVVGQLLAAMAEYTKTSEVASPQGIPAREKTLAPQVVEIAARLAGKAKPSAVVQSEDEFLRAEFGNVSLEGLGLPNDLANVLQQRAGEILKCIKSDAPLAVIFLCGSSLEGILLGIASNMPAIFNQANSCPKDKESGKPQALHKWTLNDLINVAYEVGLIALDVKKFGHELRDFRNYIHPSQQLASKFSPTTHTAKISWHVLQAAIHQLRSKIQGS